MAGKNVSIEVMGDKKLIKAFSRLTGPEQKKAFRKGAREGAKVVTKEVKNRSPKDTGQLKKDAKTRSIPRSRKVIGAMMTVQNPVAGHLEYGTADIDETKYITKSTDAKQDQALRQLHDGIDKAIADMWRKK